MVESKQLERVSTRGFSNALRIQPCRTANERKILFILKKEEFGFAFIDIRTATQSAMALSITASQSFSLAHPWL